MNANFRSKFRNELSVKANFRSKIRVNSLNKRHCENSANFLRTFALDKNSPFFVEKPRNSPISSNYVLITFSQYCMSLCNSNLHLSSLEDRHFLFYVSFLYKAWNGYMNIDILSFVSFFSDPARYPLRGRENLTLKKNYGPTTTFKFSFFYRIVDM